MGKWTHSIDILIDMPAIEPIELQLLLSPLFYVPVFFRVFLSLDHNTTDCCVKTQVMWLQPWQTYADAGDFSAWCCSCCLNFQPLCALNFVFRTNGKRARSPVRLWSRWMPALHPVQRSQLLLELHVGSDFSHSDGPLAVGRHLRAPAGGIGEQWLCSSTVYPDNPEKHTQGPILPYQKKQVHTNYVETRCEGEAPFVLYLNLNASWWWAVWFPYFQMQSWEFLWIFCIY